MNIQILYLFFLIPNALGCEFIKGKILSYQGLYIKILAADSYIKKYPIKDVCNYSPSKVS